jgi:hypothetical protein
LGRVIDKTKTTSAKAAIGCQTRKAIEPKSPAQNHLFLLINRRLKASKRTMGVLGSGPEAAG